MVFIGVDPGITGAIAVISDSQPVVFDIPTIHDDKNRSAIDPVALKTMLLNAIAPARAELCVCVLEKAQSMPRDGTVGAFRYGVTYGIIKTALLLSGFTVIETPSNSWRPKLVGKGADKEASRAMALERYPQLADSLSRKKDHNRAEAVLLADYARMLYTPLVKGKI